MGIKHDHAARVAVKWEEEIERPRRSTTFVQILSEKSRRQLGYGNSHMGEPQRFHAGRVRQGAAFTLKPALRINRGDARLLVEALSGR